MNSNAKRILLGAGIAAAGVAAAAATAYAVSEYLVKLALDREPPKGLTRAQGRLMGDAPDEALIKEVESAMHRLESDDGEVIELIAHDGTRLVAHWHPCENAERVIVAMHGWRSSWSRDFCMISEFWKENRCSVLYAEQRGQGGSGGDYIGFGMIERHDCLRWVNLVNELTGGELPVYLAGLSMGASTVLMATGLELPSNVRGVMADCGYTSPHAIWKHVVESSFHISYGIHAGIASDICRKKIQMGTRDCSAVDALRENDIPVLFVHGTDDLFVPIEMTYENYKACAAPKRLLVVPGAGHGMSFHVDRERYKAAVLDFWRDFDHPADAE